MPRTVRRRAGYIVAGLCAAVAVDGSPLAAQPGGPTVTVSVFGPDTLQSVTPPFVVNATGFGSARPLRIRLQVGLDSRLGSLVVDTTLLADAIVAIQPARALPQDAQIYYRATVTDPSSGLSASSPITGPRTTPPWVTLLTPPAVVGQPVRTRRPRFVWRSPTVAEPPGPWAYTLIISPPSGAPIENFVGSNTSFTPSTDLESNAVYRWSVRAQLPRSGQGTIVDSPNPFVVEDSMVSIATTELYRAFPSPFPGLVSPTTCIWFDLKRDSAVELEVMDLRGVHVRRLVPNTEVIGVLRPGRYGRGRAEFAERCDRRFEWDGRDDRGAYVPEGVYVIRFRGDGVQRLRRVVFRGAR